MHEENTGKQVRVFGEIVRNNNSVPVVSADGVYDYNQTDEHGNKKTQEQLNEEFKTAIENGVTISTTETQTSVKLVEGTEFRVEAGTGVKVGKWGEVYNSIEIKADTDVIATKTDLTAKADKADTYTKEQVDAAIEDVAFLGDDEGQAVIPEFDPQTDTLLKTTQSLTNTEKETVIGNILDKNYIAGSYVGKGKKYLKLNVGAPVATDFDGFVDGATTEQSSLAEVPDNIYFDRTNNRFIASKGEGLLMKYYMSWQNSDAYMNPNSGVYFKNGDNYYQWNGTTLEAITVSNVNKLTQADFDSDNTVYVIRYDFDLCGQSITIPEGCVLEFDGGSLSNGTITSNNTEIFADENSKIFGIDVFFSGKFITEKSSVKWFGAVGDGVTDDSDAIQECIHFASNNVKSNICYLPAGTYGISKSLYIYSNKRVHIKGDSGCSTIKAIASMDYMVGLEVGGANNWFSDFSDFKLNGNRNGLLYYDDGNFIYTNVSLAKHGFYFREPFRYGKFENVNVENVDDFCIYGIAWCVYILHCDFRNSGFGVYANAANATHITNSNFSQLGYIGLIFIGGNIQVTENTFDVCGRCCIVVSSSKSAVIKGNYFERCSVNGMKFCNYDIDHPLTNTYYPSIVATGNNTINYQNRNTEYYILQTTYPNTGTIIDSNYIDWADDLSNKYFVIASSLKGSEVTNNSSIINNFDAIIGVYLHANATYVYGMNISRNFAMPNKLRIEPIKSMESSTGNKTVLGNVYSEDESECPIYTCNLSNEFCVYGGYNDRLIVEQSDNYRGNRVFKNVSSYTTILYLNPKYGSSDYTSVDPNLFTGKILYANYYYKADVSSDWKVKLQNGSSSIMIEIPAGAYITMPQVYVAGYKHCDNRGFTPIAPTDRGILPMGIRFLPDTFVRCAGPFNKEHPCMNGFKITALNNNNSNDYVVLSKGVMMTRSAADDAVTNYNYNGFWFIDITSGKILYRKDGYWVDATGVIAGTPTSGTFANKPTVAANNIPVGFKYFCTDKQTTEGATDGIMIYYKGQDTTDPNNPVDVWVDALGRTIS